MGGIDWLDQHASDSVSRRTVSPRNARSRLGSIRDSTATTSHLCEPHPLFQCWNSDTVPVDMVLPPMPYGPGTVRRFWGPCLTPSIVLARDDASWSLRRRNDCRLCVVGGAPCSR